MRKLGLRFLQQVMLMYTELAQQIIEEIVSTHRQNGDLDLTLNVVLKGLTSGLSADRGVVWQPMLDQLVATQEYTSIANQSRVVGTTLKVRESTQVVLGFLSRFVDESGSGVIELDAQSDIACEWAPILQSADGVRWHLLVQLRSQGLFRGFLDFQSEEVRQWTDTEVTAVQQVSAMLSIIVVDAFMLSQSNADISNLAAVVETLALFREEPDPVVAASKSATVLAKSFGSKQSRLYLFDPDSNTLIGHDESLRLTDSENPFVSVFNQAQPMILNPASIATSHPDYFGSHRGIVMPLRAEEKTLGVLAFWERSPELKPFQPQERPVAFWLSAHLAKCIAFSTLRKE
jgi:hypothetical protein